MSYPHEDDVETMASARSFSSAKTVKMGNLKSLQEGLDDIFNNNENVATYTRRLIEGGLCSYFTLLAALIVNGHRHEEMRLQSLSRRFDITAQDLHQALQRFEDKVDQMRIAQESVVSRE